MERRNIEFQIGEALADGRFEILDRTDAVQTPIGSLATPLGEGATASVYRCRQKLGDSYAIRAMKVFNPTKELLEKRSAADQTEVHSAFLSEIANLADLNHQNLVKVVDAGKHRGNEFFVMDYVSGPTVEQICDPSHPDHLEWKTRANNDPFEIVRMARQVCWALSYLHERGYFHMDVAPKNIFLSKINKRPHVILGDLGVAKRLRGDEINGDDLVFAAGTKEFCPAIAAFLRGKEVSIRALNAVAEAWDCYAVARVLLILIGLPNNTTDLRTVSLFAKQVEKHPEKYSASEIADELTRLMPEQLTTVGVKELSAASVGSTTSISIPLYDVPISHRISKVIDHPTFARLRLIPQLLLVRTVYPGAQHSRFEHALGSYELTRRVLLQLIAQPDFLLEFRTQEIEETIVAVLLIHISSFQLHHVFEEAFDEEELQIKNAAGNEVSMLEWFLDLEAPNIGAVADGDLQRSEPDTLRSVIQQEFPSVNINEVLGVLKRKKDGQSFYNGKKNSLRVVSAIVRSSLDVRVMDYMVRDAHHAGVDSGTNVDIDHIIRCMRVRSTPFRLLITKHGVHAVENLLCARYWMYSRVYWNDLNRSMFAMLRHVVIRLVDSKSLNIEEFVRATVLSDERSALGHLLNCCAGKSDLRDASEILNCLLLPRPRPFRTLLEVTQHLVGTPAELIDAYRNRKPRELNSFLRNIAIEIKEETGVEVYEGDILIDVPRDRLDKLGADVNVLIGENAQTLVSSSKIVDALPEAFKTSAVKLRVFWSHRLRREMRSKSITVAQVQNIVKPIVLAWT